MARSVPDGGRKKDAVCLCFFSLPMLSGSIIAVVWDVADEEEFLIHLPGI